MVRIDGLESAQRETNKRLNRLETVGRDSNRRLGRIESTLSVSSKLFELMYGRLENLEEGQNVLVEGQKALVDGQKALVDGQKAVIDRLDRLVEMGMRERTEQAERLLRLEERMEVLERDYPPRQR